MQRLFSCVDWRGCEVELGYVGLFQDIQFYLVVILDAKKHGNVIVRIRLSGGVGGWKPLDTLDQIAEFLRVRLTTCMAEKPCFKIHSKRP